MLTAPWLFLAASLVGAWFTFNAYLPFRKPIALATMSFFAGWLTTELALHHVAWQVAAAAAFVGFGGLAAWPGWVALGVSLASWVFLFGCWRRAGEAHGVFERALTEGLGARALAHVPASGPLDWKQLVFPLPTRPRGVIRERDIAYAEDLCLDVYHAGGDLSAKRPILLNVHGGAWILGSKDEQGLPMVLHLAARGWVCVSTNYRLAPRATFPEPLVDVKRALAWIRKNAARFGGDPDFVVIAGNSAGGHLASLASLTANEVEYQPGFEDVDTSVKACVAFYGVYDFTDRFGVWPHAALLRLVERSLIKERLDVSRDAFERASPISRIHAGAPPFLVIHGDHDTLVPVGEARKFVEELRKETREPAVYAEIPGAQHAFEIFPSLRTLFVVRGVERFLVALRARHETPAAG